MASTTMFYALLAKSKLIVGSRLIMDQAACTSPLNNQSMNAPNATLRDSTKEDLDTYLMEHRYRDGFAVTATTALAHPIKEEYPYKKLQTGN